MTSRSSVEHDLHELNHQYLLTLRDHSLRDQASACVRFGVSADVAQAVKEMPLAELKRISETGELLFRSALSANDLNNLTRVDECMREVLITLAHTREMGES